MLSIWPVIQPMSLVADFACCAILDFRSPSGNDYDNQGMPSRLSDVARNATTELTVQTGRFLTGLKHSGLQGNTAENPCDYRTGSQNGSDSRTRAIYGTGRAAGFGSGTNPPASGMGLGHAGNRPSGNR